jgi:hypothetical protein
LPNFRDFNAALYQSDGARDEWLAGHTAFRLKGQSNPQLRGKGYAYGGSRAEEITQGSARET